MGYTGTIYRGVDYSPTWSGWAQNAGNTQTNDSDFANDAFASLWGSGYQAAPAGDPSNPGAPPNPPGSANPIYRDDLGTIHTDTFNLVRLYNWDPARGTAYTSPPYPPAAGAGALPATSDIGLDHINFLNYANTEKLKIVVPVSDYFISNGFQNGAWGGATPDSKYSFGSAPLAIQDAFKQFIASITDPATGKIHTAVHSIDVGNEGDLATALTDGTTASQFLARTNWWIYNLHQEINGAGPALPYGTSSVNGSTGAIIPITATISTADLGASPGGWWADLINGVTTSTLIPNGYAGWQPPPPNQTNTFTAAVPGLSSVDPTWASYYYNSFNISQDATALTGTLAAYDAGSTTVWPFANFNVPLMLMETFAPGQTNAAYSVAQAAAIETYLSGHQAGTTNSTTNVMGYNYYEFNDEPALNLFWGLYNYSAGTSTNADTGTTTTFYGAPAFPDISFPVDTLTAAAGTGSYATLWQAWTAQFPPTQTGTAANDKLLGTTADDRIQGLAGNDSIDGGQGFDIAIYGQNARGYTLKATAGSATITIQDKVGTDGTDTLTSIEHVRFADGALSTAGLGAAASLPAAQILKVVDLYTAGLGRAPDALGLDYWASQLANGASLKDISKAILGSAEAAPIFSSNNSNSVFVNLEYQAALGRAPDAAGAAYWTNELDTGHIQRTDFVTALIAGASGADKQYIANKEAVGAHFALTQGLSDVAWARTVESAVNGTAASVTTANAQTDAFAATAATAAGTELVVQILGIVP